MTFEEYSQKAIQTDTFEGKLKSVDSPAFISKVLGLVGESGEVAEKFKKILRDKNGVISEDETREILKELGDIMWYINAVTLYLGGSLEQVAQTNLEKVHGRKSRGVTHGSGDNR